ncbi:putative GTP-binding protein 6 [Tribolium castaneum]|uniref:putative GTP-binding protein 6 n=1 Tax=Tribolium castaneum TaxID=7070 RepID=UPI0030FE739E
MLVLNRFAAISRKLNTVFHAKVAFHLSHRLKNENKNLYDEILTEDREFLAFSENYFKFESGRNCYIIQPYIKWGPQKLQGITPIEQLDEAKALVNTLPSWNIQDSISVPLESFDKKTLFKSGSLDKLRQIIRKNSTINAVFVNLGTLKKAQIVSLEREFGVPILDRYKVVMYILKLHAVSKHAKLQVALAELYYLQRSTFHEANFGKAEREKVKLMFQTREQKLKNAIKELRTERALLRNKRQKIDFPVVAVVGYTNAGKTSLIKALTGEERLRPKNQLFATLDVTLHAGLLPSGMKVLYVDTVGFISDIPTNLIECFVATLEDAVLADVILHVEDISSSFFEFKRKHVLATLQDLATNAGTGDVLNKVISVGNKCDLVPKETDFGILKVSSKDDTGLDVLRMTLEKAILENTNRAKIKIRVPVGGDAIRWLYKNSTVISESPDEKNVEFVIANVIITQGKLEQFKHNFSK